jgi:hypothetical protein
MEAEPPERDDAASPDLGGTGETQQHELTLAGAFLSLPVTRRVAAMVFGAVRLRECVAWGRSAFPPFPDLFVQM